MGLFIIKAHSKSRVERNYLSLIKTVYRTPKDNIIFNGKKLKAFALILRTRQGCLLSPLSFNIFLEVLAMKINPEKRHTLLKACRL